MYNKSEILPAFRAWRQAQSKDSCWAVIISADPDALASAMAFKRIMHIKTRCVDIFKINEITRPDNLAMIRYLHIPVKSWLPDKCSGYTHFAIVDSQPCHSPFYSDRLYSLIIDHHPPTDFESLLAKDAFVCIRPEIGATSTLMTQFLQTCRVRPGPLLATALTFGIRTDTDTFERSGGEEDLRAYQWLFHHVDINLLRRISRSEYLRSWLPYFSRLFNSIVDCPGSGAYAALKEIPSSDLLVATADFFTKVHGLKWVAVSGILDNKVIVVFRGDGSRDIGRFADACFYDIGTAGGHRNMGRAEFPLSEVPKDISVSTFILNRLQKRKPRAKTQRKSDKT